MESTAEMNFPMIGVDVSDVCQVCLLHKPDETVYVCDSCNDCIVHENCYYIEEDTEKKGWKCNPCAANATKPKCEICRSCSGPMKSTDTPENGWAHVYCALFTSATWIDPESDKIMEVANIPPGFFKLKCEICKEKRGACIQCTAKRCTRSFHPLCARSTGYTMMDMTPNEASRTLRTLCEKHTMAESAPIGEKKKPQKQPTPDLPEQSAPRVASPGVTESAVLLMKIATGEETESDTETPDMKTVFKSKPTEQSSEMGLGLGLQDGQQPQSASRGLKRKLKAGEAGKKAKKQKLDRTEDVKVQQDEKDAPDSPDLGSRDIPIAAAKPDAADPSIPAPVEQRTMVTEAITVFVGKFMASDIEKVICCRYGHCTTSYGSKAEHIAQLLNREDLCRAVMKSQISIKDLVNLED